MVMSAPTMSTAWTAGAAGFRREVHYAAELRFHHGLRHRTQHDEGRAHGWRGLGRIPRLLTRTAAAGSGSNPRPHIASMRESVFWFVQYIV
jgi:hypothetical protein